MATMLSKVSKTFISVFFALTILSPAHAAESGTISVTVEQLNELIEARVNEILLKNNLIGESRFSAFEENLRWYSQKQAAEKNKAEMARKSRTAKNLPPIDTMDHIYGDVNAPVKIIEYSDFECPYCRQFHPTMLKVVDDSEGQIAWVYRHFPLDFHDGAMPKAMMSECVASAVGNDAFWEFTNEVINLKATDAKTIMAMGIKHGLSEAAATSCLEDNVLKAQIEAEMAAGSAAGVTGTPGNFVISGSNIEAMPGAVPYEGVMETVNKYLKN